MKRSHWLSVAMVVLGLGGAQAWAQCCGGCCGGACDEVQMSSAPAPAPAPGVGAVAKQINASMTEVPELPPAPAEAQPALYRASKLVGVDLKDPAQHRIGTVQDVVVDRPFGRVAYVAVQLDHPAAGQSASHYYAVPIQALSLEKGDRLTPRAVVLDTTAHPLGAHQGFDSNQTWPMPTDRAWLADLYESYGVARYWERLAPETAALSLDARAANRPPASESTAGLSSPQIVFDDNNNWSTDTRPQLDGHWGIPPSRVSLPAFWSSRVSKLAYTQVNDPLGRQLGTLQDLVIDAPEGAVAYGIVAHGGLAGLGETLTAVPWPAVSPERQATVIVLDSDRATLDRLAFGKDRWPNLADPEYVNRVAQTFHAPSWEVFATPLPRGK